MTDNPKRKLAFSVFARSEATTQSQYINQKNKTEIAAVIRQSADSLAMTRSIL